MRGQRNPRGPVQALIFLSTLTLLASCGDDLESRQQAVESRQPVGGSGITVGDASSRTNAPVDDATAEGFADEQRGSDGGEPMMEEAAPEELIDTAQGFAAEPMDDARGFDPTPADSGGFAADPVSTESFED